MSKFTEYIGGQFRKPTGIVGRVCCLIMNVINRRMYRKTVSLIHIPEAAKTLDIGYGNGKLLRRMYKTHRPDMYGIDISEDMQVLASKKNKAAARAGRLHLQVGDCCDLPFEDDTFWAITSINTVYFWRDTVKGLSEIYRCLQKGGVFFNVVYTKEWLEKLAYTQNIFRLFTPDELVEMGSDAGFSDVCIQMISKGRSFAIIYRK